MKTYLPVIILFYFLVALTCRNVHAQEPLRNLPPSYIIKASSGPWCLVLINNRHYAIECGLIDSLIKPKSIRSLKVEKDAAVAAIYGYRAGNGIVIIEIEKRNWKSEFPRLKPYLKNL